MDIFRDPDGWEYLQGGPIVRDGKFPEDCSAASMAATPERIYMIRWRAFQKYDIYANKWENYITSDSFLPETIGPGADIVFDGKNSLYITRGANLPNVWRYDIAEKRFCGLPFPPNGIGSGGHLALKGDHLYALRGGGTREIWRYSISEGRWHILPPIVCGSYLNAGETCSGLVCTKDYILTWTDHHTQIYNPDTGVSTSFICTFRPWVSGSMFAYDEEADIIYMAQGRGSRTLGKLLVKENAFCYLHPRTPDGLLVEGNRMVLVKLDGIKYLYIFRGFGTSEFWRIPVEKLQTTTRHSA